MASSAAATFTVEDAQLIFKNFGGAESQFNAKGNRNFCVILGEDEAATLSSDGWNVRTLEGREEGDSDVPYIQVAVNFENRPPRVVLISSSGRDHLSEDEVEILDYADIKQVDLVARAYNWEVNGKTGIKAYLKTMFVTIQEDELERKYAAKEGHDND